MRVIARRIENLCGMAGLSWLAAMTRGQVGFVFDDWRVTAQHQAHFRREQHLQRDESSDEWFEPAHNDSVYIFHFALKQTSASRDVAQTSVCDRSVDFSLRGLAVARTKVHATVTD